MLMLLLTSTFMVILSHPLSLGFNILIHTIITCMFMGMMSMNFWFSYILMLIMIGGLLVLFIYMTSIASNEKFKFNINILITFMLMTLLFMFMDLNMPLYSILTNELTQNITETKTFFMNLSKFMNYPNSNIFVMIMFYLLISMIAVVKISKFNYGPLRQLKYENTYT
uniref:NADH-ubiquinone oxidoreductase chain 6 n=1 Tax=Hippodamia undecimnotata TaxID=703263 RepID=A0A343C320_9CUCU|nr:NADH dehydrogenase subunit 6 [Hippodamia undecimnotata]